MTNNAEAIRLAARSLDEMNAGFSVMSRASYVGYAAVQLREYADILEQRTHTQEVNRLFFPVDSLPEVQTALRVDENGEHGDWSGSGVEIFFAPCPVQTHVEPIEIMGNREWVFWHGCASIHYAPDESQANGWTDERLIAALCDWLAFLHDDG